MSDALSLAEKLQQLLKGWVVCPPKEGETWADLIRGDGARIRITVGGYRMDGRITFRGCWPQYQDGTIYSGGATPSITCAQGTSIEGMVRHVMRRLLPEYDPVYAEAHHYVSRRDARSAEAEIVAHRIAGTIGACVGRNNSRRGDGVSIVDEPEVVRQLVVRPAYDGVDGERGPSVDFAVHGLDPETAARVLEIIRAAEGQRIAVPTRVAQDEPAEVDPESAVVRQRRAV